MRPGLPTSFVVGGSWFSPVTACPNLVFFVDGASQSVSQSNSSQVPYSLAHPLVVYTSHLPSCTQPRNSSQDLPTKHISLPSPPSPHRRPIPRLRPPPLPRLMHPLLRRAPCAIRLPLHMPRPTSPTCNSPNLLARSRSVSLTTHFGKVV